MFSAKALFLILIVSVYAVLVDGALSGLEQHMRAKRQHCLNYPCPPGSTPDVPNWGYYHNYQNHRYYNRYYGVRGYHHHG
uniref:Uncharacterized protein n=1 Tax=Steinernema glaseri TaxID=37863 RepID=A0A1I7ZFC1_9BILA